MGAAYSRVLALRLRSGSGRHVTSTAPPRVHAIAYRIASRSSVTFPGHS